MKYLPKDLILGYVLRTATFDTCLRMYNTFYVPSTSKGSIKVSTLPYKG